MTDPQNPRGSADWRDNQEDRFSKLLEMDPLLWAFDPSAEDITRVTEAYASAPTGRVPDVDFIKMLMAHQFDTAGDFNETTRKGSGRQLDVREVADFFTKRFCADMYLEFKNHGQTIEMVSLWTLNKIRRILGEVGLQYMDYQVEEVNLHLLNPQSLIDAANRMQTLEVDGYGLSDHSVENDMVVYFFRKEHIVSPKNTTPIQPEARPK